MTLYIWQIESSTNGQPFKPIPTETTIFFTRRAAQLFRSKRKPYSNVAYRTVRHLMVKESTEIVEETSQNV